MTELLRKRSAIIFRPFLLVAALLVVAAAVYAPGLSGDFVFDDTTSLLINNQLQIGKLDLASLKMAALSGDAGPFKRPLSMLSFAVNYYVAGGFDPQYFKAVNLGIHILNGVSLYLFLSLLLAGFTKHKDADDSLRRRSQWLAIAVTSAWLLHPLATTSVLYVVQRMNSLATLFTLWGLILYLRGRHVLDEGKDKKGLLLMVSGIAGFGALASLSKENGVLLPLFALIIESVVFRFRAHSLASKRTIQGIFLVTIAAPLIAALLYTAIQPGWLLDPYRIRGFSLSERLLTESRVLWWYLKWIVLPSYNELGLFHDDIRVSTTIVQPLTTLFSAIALVALVFVAYVFRKRDPVITFGILWFLAGHCLESSFLALELVHEHRNYLPMVGILLLVFHGLFAITAAPRLQRFGWPATVLLILLFGSVTSLRAHQWSNNTSLALSEAEHHPDSARATYQAGRQYMVLLEHDKANRILHDRARYFLERSTNLDARSTSGLFGLIYLAHMGSQEIDPAVVGELKQRLTYTFISAYEKSSLEKLAAADGKDSPSLTHDSVVAVYNAAIGNPTLQPGVRAVLFSDLSAYYANQRHAYPEAVALAIKAIEAAPDNPAFYMSFANLLIAMHHYDAAHEQLQMAAQKDHLGYFNTEIAATESRIKQYVRLPSR